MKKLILSAAILVLAVGTFTSCRKDDKLADTANLYDNFVKTRQSQEQLFTINGATGGTITGKGNGKITFPPNCFANPDNTIFTGNAIVSLRESWMRSLWIMDGLAATTKTNVLQSGGMMNVVARRADNGVELLPAPAMRLPNVNLNAVIKAEVPKPAGVQNVDMNLFLPDTLANGQPAVSPTLPPQAWFSAAYFPFGNGTNSYVFQLPKFRWVNCDGLANQPGIKTTIKVTPDLSGFAGASQIQAILVYRNINSAITLPPGAGFFESYSNSISIGSVADVVCLGKAADGRILFKVLPATSFTANMNIAITPVIATAVEVDAYLNSLN